MITFENVSKSFGPTHVLKNISLSIRNGETFCLLGNSGSGKTTLLKLINKLFLPDEGNIYYKGHDINTIDHKKLRKNIGYVIQTGGLFPHMKIGENIALPMQLFGESKTDINKRITELIAQIGLDESYLDRYPNTLSGGQQQRIGIARAIANKPELLLLDEPFSALDPVLRDQMQNDFMEMSFLNEVTKIIVTHDLKEALKLGDRICLMGNGEILFTDTPLEFLKSDNLSVKKYIGEESVSLMISQLKFTELNPEAITNPQNIVDTDYFLINEQSSVYQILNSHLSYARFLPNGKIYSMRQIKKAFLQYLDHIL